MAYSNFTLILSNTNKGPNNLKPKEVINPKLKEVIIPLKLKQWRQGVSIDTHKAYKTSAFAIRSPKAKRMCGDKKGKDPIEING